MTLRQWLVAPVASLVMGLPSTVSAVSPTVAELVQMIQQHHPEYLAMQARTDQVGGERDEAGAAFDLSVVQESYIRPSGYYDGAYAEQRLVQPLKSLNAQVFGSYRISTGEFPIYEANSETLDLGEASLGVKLSLLQNRDTDKRRMAQVTAAWRYMEAESKQLAQLNKLIYDGVSAYLGWYQSHQKLAVVQNLVSLTENRLDGVQTRVNSGDLAQINLTEFKTTLLRRQLLEREARQRFELARQNLSYFWRTADTPDYQSDAIDTPPTNIDWPFSMPSANGESFKGAIDAHPGLAVLSAQVEQARNKRRLAQNETLPQLDLELKLARDLGEGTESLTGTESMVGLSFSMPLGQRAAKAREAIADAEIRSLEYEQQVLREQLRRDLDLSLKALDYVRNILTLSRQQEALAETLLSQEQARFDEGVSDQFLLITREKTALEAHLKTIDAQFDVLRHELALHATLASLHAAEPLSDT